MQAANDILGPVFDRMRGEEEELGLRNAWNAGWARHYAAGGPTPGQMGQAYSYGRMITSGMGGAEEDLGLRNAWNAGWARHYAAGGPTPGQMGQAYSYGRMITSGMGGAEDDILEYQ